MNPTQSIQILPSGGSLLCSNHTGTLSIPVCILHLAQFRWLTNVLNTLFPTENCEVIPEQLFHFLQGI